MYVNCLTPPAHLTDVLHQVLDVLRLELAIAQPECLGDLGESLFWIVGIVEVQLRETTLASTFVQHTR